MLGKVLGVFLIGALVASAAGAAERGITAGAVAPTAKRVALVIGNDRYETLPALNNAGKDARDVAATLGLLGFDVILKTNAGRRDVSRALAEFEGKLGGAEAGLVFYAGHGIQSAGRNYLVPSDARIELEEDLRFEGIESAEFLDTMARAGAAVNILIIDACRDNPLPRRSRSAARGLTAVPVPAGLKGTAILYSAGPGQTAQDGPEGGNGVFTGALLAALDRPGQSVEQVFKETARRVNESTGGRQTPWNNSSLTGDFYFQTPASNPPAAASSGDEVVFWQSIVDSTNAAMFEEYLRQYPKGRFSGLARIKLEELKGAQVASLPPSPPSPPSEPSGPPRDLVREVQRLLNAHGYAVGAADGIAGSRTLAAVRSFQSAGGLTATGNIDESLVSALRRIERPLKPGDGFRDCEGATVAMAGSALPGVFCGPEMVVVPAGAFDMGDVNDAGSVSENPVHRVTIARPFAVGVHEVTMGEYRTVTGKNPADLLADHDPVLWVSWLEAQAFAKQLSDRTGRRYRLLSEAEWEYVARAGARTKYPWGNDVGRGNANCKDCRNKQGDKPVTPVGSFAPNGFGLFDTAGNVAEWVEDCWNDSYDNAPGDGRAWTQGDCTKRAVRGGSWYGDADVARPAARSYLDAVAEEKNADGFHIINDRREHIGFRVARDL